MDMLDLMACMSSPNLLQQVSKVSLYSQTPLNFINPTVHSATALVTTSQASNTLHTWHLRLGHPNHNTLKLVYQLCNMPISNKYVVVFCDACCVCKSHRLPSSPSLSVYNSPLSLVYSDLWEPSPMDILMASITTLHLLMLYHVSLESIFLSLSQKLLPFSNNSKP